MKIINKMFSKLIQEVKLLFWSGLLTLLPLTLTIGFFAFSFKLIKSWFNPISLIIPSTLKTIPFAEFIVIIATVFCVGAVLKFLLLQPLVDKVEQLFHKIPLIRPIYFGIKQLIAAFSPHDKIHFQQVILVEFPRKGVYSLGFVTGTVPNGLSPHNHIKNATNNHPYVSVFIPNTPNPTTGWYVILPQADCTSVNLTRQEAMTLIISGGIITPERLAEEAAQKNTLKET